MVIRGDEGMDLKAGLWQQQTLKLAMTQELSQAIALLQYSAQELTEFLENKSLENPLLQIDAVNIRPINPQIDRGRRKAKRQRNEANDWIERIAAAKQVTLEEQLLSQINIKKLSQDELKAIRGLIQSLDENGYYTGSLEELAKSIGVPFEAAEDGLAILQTLEPAGIGARDLQECLLLQLENNELAQTILQDYFGLFAEKKWKQIAKEIQVTLPEIQAVFDEIQLLNPKPGAQLHAEHTSYIIPDAIIERTADGLQVSMFDDLLPKISFNDTYYKELTAAGDRQVSQFLQEKVQECRWIFKSIEQRKETLTKVIMKLAEKQAAFFQKGPQALQPMTMKEIAAELGIHESTVSRAVREKYVQTPYGTSPLKSFFTSTIQTVLDESASSAQVKQRITALIEQENKQKPLSDQEIVEQLKSREGMVLSRRTVAKYRDQLGIPSSSKRKRF
jgi:RNA polymerase sigma-54 factor